MHWPRKPNTHDLDGPRWETQRWKGSLLSHISARSCRKELNPVFLDSFGMQVLGRLLGAQVGCGHSFPRHPRWIWAAGLGIAVLPPAPLAPGGGPALCGLLQSKRRTKATWCCICLHKQHGFAWLGPYQMRIAAFCQCHCHSLQGMFLSKKRTPWWEEDNGLDYGCYWRYLEEIGNLSTWRNQCRVSRGGGFQSNSCLSAGLPTTATKGAVKVLLFRGDKSHQTHALQKAPVQGRGGSLRFPDILVA